MSAALAAIGAVLVFEGLVLALAPARLDEILRMISELPIETRRTIGLAGLALGTALLWLAQGLGGG